MPQPPGKVFLGLTVTELTGDLRRRLGLEKGVTGVVVESVEEGAAQRAGIRQGDVIQMINNTRVATVEEFVEQIEKLPGDSTTAVLVARRDGPIFLALRVPER